MIIEYGALFSFIPVFILQDLHSHVPLAFTIRALGNEWKIYSRQVKSLTCLDRKSVV